LTLSAGLLVRINKHYIEDVIYGRKNPLFIGALLRVLSIFYGLIIRLRNALYVHSVFKRKRLAQRVISVGNITLGGTGKTPTVMHIAEVLLKHQKHPAVISRGYGRNNESALVVVSDGDKVLVGAETGGDEPVLIGSKLAYVPVVADSNRYRAALFANQKFRNDAFILDDGFQHLSVQRDLDIVLIDASDPFGNGRLFPAGILREPLSALQRAHVVLITGADRVDDLAPLKRVIRRNTPARIFTSRQVAADLLDAVTGETKPLSSLRSTAVLAFSGIARPASFMSLLLSLGAEVKAEFSYPDHYVYKSSDLVAIRERAAKERLDMIITTEKDVVRLKGLKPDGIWALRIELKIVENEEWEAVLLHKL
jgi:tetraacyldisaccharide 4'-kinase